MSELKTGGVRLLLEQLAEADRGARAVLTA